MLIINFNSPYPRVESLKNKIRTSLIFSAFVFLFLWFFQPFGLSSLSVNITFVAFGYGSVCFIIMVLLDLIQYQLFPSNFNEEHWTVGKEILWILLNLLLIGVGNFLYSFAIGIIVFSFYNLAVFSLYTIAIGIFPVSAAILINQARLNSKFEHESSQLNPIIERAKKEGVHSSRSRINIMSESGTHELECWPDEFLYAKSDDNYVEIHFLQQNKRSRKIVRSTLKNLYATLPDEDEFFRCHKSYIINLSKLKHISGNAQGYKLHLIGIEEVIPVSRNNNSFIKNYLAFRP